MNKLVKSPGELELEREVIFKEKRISRILATRSQANDIARKERLNYQTASQDAWQAVLDALFVWICIIVDEMDRREEGKGLRTATRY